MDLRPRDEATFTRTRDELVAAFASWAGDDVVVDVANLLLTGRFALDAWHDLTDWTPELVAEVLLEWLPHATLLDDEYVDAIPDSTVAFLRFLQQVHGIPLEVPLTTWVSGLHALLPHVNAARADADAHASPARQLMLAMQDDAVDLDDDAAVQDWIAGYNARVQALGPEAGVRIPELDDDPGPLDPAELRPFVLPPRDQLARQAAATPLVRRLDTFLDWIGPGRPVTKTGNLKIADGYELVDLLGTDDLAPIAGMQRPRVQSAAELRDVDWVYEVARGLGWVSTSATRLYAEPDDDLDPLARWQQVWLTVLRLRPLDHARGGHRTPLAGDVIDLLDEGIVELLLVLHESDRGLPVEDLAEDVMAQGLLGRRVDPTAVAVYERWVDQDVRALLDRLEEVGVVEVADVRTYQGEYGRERSGGVIGITPLGEWALSHLVGAGSPEEVMAGVALDDLLDVIDASDEDVFARQLAAWTRAHPDAIAEVVDAVREGEAGGMVELGFALLHVWGPDAIPQVRTLVDEPQVGALARVFLARHGDEVARSSLDVDAPEALLDVLASILDTFGPQALADEVDGLGPPDELAVLFERLWRVEHDAVERVLETIGKFHHDKAVAKSARKALFKHRTART